MTARAILVLGGRVRRPGRGALDRRIFAGIEAARRDPGAFVVACGGRSWDGLVEADAIAERMLASGVGRERVLRDRLSLTTLENLVEARRALARVGASDARWTIVTCDWHLPRALAIARALGVAAVGHPAKSPDEGQHVVRALREGTLRWIDTRCARGIA